MATVTAFILVGMAHQNSSGINPTHYIMLYENDQPSLSLYKFENNKEIIRIRPTPEKIVDNIYLLIHTFVLKSDIFLSNNISGKEIHKLFNEEKNKMSYEKIITSLETYDFKVVFNILSGSTLQEQIDRIKEYPNDYEITIPKFRKEYSFRSNKIVNEEY